MKRKKPFSIIFQDDYITVVNKASGLLVAQDRWNLDAPRLDKLVSKEVCNKDERLYAVHRIDKDTSGLVMYAKTADAHRNLCNMFSNHQVHKTYHALVHGRPLDTEFSNTSPLRTDSDARHRTKKDSKKGKKSITHFKLIGICGQYSWIEAKPITGRTHQIRVHLALLNLPIVCDSLYGSNQALYLSKIKRKWQGDEFEERPLLGRLGLHAWKLEFTHPIRKEKLCFTAPYPKDFNATRNQLAKLFNVDPLETKSI